MCRADHGARKQVKTFFLVHHQARLNALEAVQNAPDGWMVQVKEKTRSIEQNALLWSRLEEVSKQVDWYGEKLTSEDWKHVFSASLKKQKAVRGIDGGFVVLGQSTSKMTKAEMADLLTLMEAFAAERGVNFKD
jgi:hypothetical protein